MIEQYLGIAAGILIVCGVIGSALAGGMPTANPVAVRVRRTRRRSVE